MVRFALGLLALGGVFVGRAVFKLVAVALFGSLMQNGCQKDEAPGERYACTCDFLTDMDDPSVQKVEVCARDENLARERAIGCAQSGAPATVQGCQCERSAAPGCPPGDCEVAERR